MSKVLESSPFEVQTLSLVGWRIKFWLYSEDPPMIGDCVNIFRLTEDDEYYLGVNFEGEDEIVGVKLADIQMVKRLKKIQGQYQVLTLSDAKKPKTNSDS